MALFRRSVRGVTKATVVTVLVVALGLLHTVPGSADADVFFTKEASQGLTSFFAGVFTTGFTVLGKLKEPGVVGLPVIRGQNRPVPWPKAFHCEGTITMGDKVFMLGAQYNYDSLKFMSFTMTPLSPTGQSGAGTEDKLTIEVNHTQMTARSQTYCDNRMGGEFYTPPREFMSRGTYAGTEEVEGKQCDVFDLGSDLLPGKQTYMKLWEDKETGYPVKVLFYNGIEIIVKKFEPGATKVVPSPERCEEEAATAA